MRWAVCRCLRGALRSASRTASTKSKTALNPLPDERFDLSQWSRARVNIDYHIAFDANYYSVPYNLLPRPTGDPVAAFESLRFVPRCSTRCAKIRHFPSHDWNNGFAPPDRGSARWRRNGWGLQGRGYQAPPLCCAEGPARRNVQGPSRLGTVPPGSASSLRPE